VPFAAAACRGGIHHRARHGKRAPASKPGSGDAARKAWQRPPPEAGHQGNGRGVAQSSRARGIGFERLRDQLERKEGGGSRADGFGGLERFSPPVLEKDYE
jgi:hypothetical protein